MATQKENCSVFTPDIIVEQMLDLLGYTENLYGHRILENSCGDGAFLSVVVRRYIADCREQELDNDEIKQGLERDIWGYEINPETAACCVLRLNCIAEENGIHAVHWNVVVADVLKTNIDIDFSYAAGNPPYITYSALKKDARRYIKENFQVCTAGKPDYYYAFVESALSNLNEAGKLVYLIPNNFFKTRFGDKLRQYLLPTLTDIYDYTREKLFAGALTSSTIIVCDRASASDSIQYHDVLNDEVYQIPKTEMEQRWVFPVNSNEPVTIGSRRFDDYFSAASTVATLCNKAFLVEKPTAELLAEMVLRPAVSAKSLTKKTTEHIIFPYTFNDDNLVRYSEEAFTVQFPHAAAHLKKHSKKLDERDKDEKALWFEYGRSQAISHMNQKKLLISTLVTGKVKVYELDENTIPYTGIYIVPKSNMPLSQAKEILESESFLSYVKRVGIHANGTSMRISISDVKEYLF